MSGFGGLPASVALSANVLRSANTSLVSATPKTVTSITLTPGTWDVSGQVGYSNGTSATIIFAGISTTTNTLPGLDGAESTLAGTFTGDAILPTPIAPMTVTVNTTVFLVAQATFTGTTTIYGTIRARKVGP